MGYIPSSFRFAAMTVLPILCLGLVGCGNSEPSAEEVRQEHETAKEAREERESREVARELKTGDFVSCGRKVYASRQSLCTFARNVELSYYTEIVAGEGKPIGYHPPAKQDYRVLCSGTVPHKCTSFKDDGLGIEPLPSGIIFFSP
jgi:hypothetical protein